MSSEHVAAADRRPVRRLMLFFAVVYVVEGVGQAKVGVVWQPLTHYLKETFGWTPVQISVSLAILDLPWIIKPLFGLVSDFVPLFGYRRRAYLLLANAGATIAYAWVAMTDSPTGIVSALLLTSFAMAVASTISGALLVENGQRYHATGRFVTQQWLWFNIATMVAAVGGGQLVAAVSPAGAVRYAAIIAAALPLAGALGTVLLVDEARAPLDLPALRQTFGGLIAALRSRRLFLIGGFLFLYYFSPGFGTPLYFHLTDRLHLSQAYIGTLAAISAAGAVAGALLHRWFLHRLSMRVLLNVSLAAGTFATLAFLPLRGEASAAAAYFLSGAAGMIANIASLTLAAENCPKRAEGFVFAALLSLTNLAGPVADNIGSYLYDHVFDRALPPLILVSAAATAAVFLLVPLLRLPHSNPLTPPNTPSAAVKVTTADTTQK